MAPPPAFTFIDTVDQVVEVVNAIHSLPTNPPSLYLDLEGINLSRHGSISIFQIHVLSMNHTYIVDVHSLRASSFTTTNTDGLSLRDILESSSIPKVFFDVRNDSDALYSHFQVKLAGIQDLQLMELATRNFPRRTVNGLAKCIDRDAPMDEDERIGWKSNKELGLRLFAPERGGSYEVFNQRPLPESILTYCVQDVRLLPRLWAYYNSKMTDVWRRRVEDAAVARVAESQTALYNGMGRHMALAPPAWSAPFDRFGEIV